MGRAEVLQRVRPERVPQGRDDEPRRQALRRRQGRPPVRLFKSHRPGIGDGDQRRDFIYVDDAVAVVRWLLETPSVSGIFNVGTGKARSFRDLISALFRALGREPNIEYVDMPDNIRGQYQYFTQAEGREPAPRRLQRRLHAAGGRRQALRHAIPRHRRPLSLSRAMFDFEKQLAEHRPADGALHRRPDARRLRLWRGLAHLAGGAGAGDRGEREDVIVGGAGNVARNIASLGARCMFVGVIGDDDAGKMLQRGVRRAQARDQVASGGRSVAADDAQAALRLRASFDPSAARRLGAGRAGRRQDRGRADQAGARGAAARRRGGAVRLRQGRADAARDPRGDRAREEARASR